MGTFRKKVEQRRRIIDFLVPLSEDEVDEVLVAHGFIETHLWDDLPEADRRDALQGILEDVNGRIDDLAADLEVAIVPSLAQAAEGSSALDGPIFVVHGHDHALLHLVTRTLERSTGRDVVVLREQANAGRTVLEKFEQHAVGASFAVVLLTGDDEGRAVNAAGSSPRGRQNVVFELGFFFGRLGRDRVVVLLEPSVEKPSDIDGLAYVALDPGGAWKRELGRELERADIEVDYARMP